MNAIQTTRTDSDSIAANQSAAVRFARMSLRELVDHIVSTHHAALRKLMPRALKLIEEAGVHHSPRSATLAALGDVLRPMWQEMQDHIIREEQVVFPAIELLDHARSRPGLHQGRIDDVIRDLDHDHHLTCEAQRLIRDLTDHFHEPPEADHAYIELMQTLAALDADLSTHTRLEDGVLFPRARQIEAELLGGR